MSKSDSLVRLVYASHKDRYVDGNELKKILCAAQQFNQVHNITGMLLFNSHYFLQALEGPREQVSSLYNKILLDKRHNKVQLLKMCGINNRQWIEWSMEFISISEKEEHIYQKYADQAKFNPFALDSECVDEFLHEIFLTIMEG